MEHVHARRRWALAAAVVACLASASGCGDACSEAADLCRECDALPQNCDLLVKDRDNEQCEALVASYEANCER